MKKIILLIIAVFFLTGCDAEYTLEISNEVKENTKIYTLKTDESKYGDSFLKDFLNQQTLSNIPIYFNPSNYDELNGEKQEGVLYYDITSYEENAFTGIEANTDLFSLTSIVRSRAIKSCYEEVTIQKNNSLYRMNTNSTCKAFENYNVLYDREKELKIADKVIHTGIVTNEELVDLYNLIDLFVFPSLYEGFGLPVIEAMACGTKVACSNSSSLLEVGGKIIPYFDKKEKQATITCIFLCFKFN